MRACNPTDSVGGDGDPQTGVKSERGVVDDGINAIGHRRKPLLPIRFRFIRRTRYILREPPPMFRRRTQLNKHLFLPDRTR